MRQLLSTFAIILSLSVLAKDVSHIRGIWNSQPASTPTHYVPDGAISGNGDIGIVLGGTAANPEIFLSKNDFWKAKTGYPDGGVCAIGSLKISTDITDSLTYHAEQSIADATISATFVNQAGNGYALSAWCSANQNIVVISVRAIGRELHLSQDFLPIDGIESIIETSHIGDASVIVRKFEDDDLDWPTAAAVALRRVGQNGAESDSVIPPGKEAIILIAVCTNHDSGENYSAEAAQRVNTLDSKALVRLRTDHLKWWNDFWDSSEISLDDSELEKYYYGSQYLLACCSRNTAFPPGLWGTSLTKDAAGPGWAGDYHTNYNFQAPWWGSYSSNHIMLTEGYDTPLLEYMQRGKDHAAKLLDKKGIYFPVGIGPKGFCSSMFPLTPEAMYRQYRTTDKDIEGGYMFLGQKSNSVFCTANMFMRFYSTYDTDYARKIYPFLRGVADFWEDWLVFEDGRYVSHDDNFWEVGPWEGANWKSYYGDINPTISLGLCRMLFSGIIDISNHLGVDSDKHEKWRHILDNLSPIPTAEIDGQRRILVCEGGDGSGSITAPGMGRVCLHGLVYPSGAFGPVRNPEFSSLMLEEIKRWDNPVEGYEFRDVGWENMSNGFEVFFPAAARLGFDGDSLLSILKHRISLSAKPNLWITQGGGGIETLSSVPSCLNEMLMQSYEGTLRILPVWNRQRKASFRNLRAYGAFLVSASCEKGEVTSLTLKSEKGRPCRLENPWPGKSLTIRRGDGTTVVKDGRTIEFSTTPGETVEVRPTE